MITVVMSMDVLPPTLNDIIGAARTNRFQSARLKRIWEKKIAPFAHDLPELPSKPYFECVWYVKNIKRDPDNIQSALKYIFDTLVRTDKIIDDNMKVIQSPLLHHFVPAKFDGFSLYIRDYEAFQERMKEDVSQPPITTSRSFPKLVNKLARQKLVLSK